MRLAHITNKDLDRLRDLLLLLLDESYSTNRVNIKANDRGKITDLVRKIEAVI